MACDPQTLLAQAKCLSCLTTKQLRAVKLFLTCQWAAGGGGGGGGDFRITEDGNKRLTEDGNFRVVQ